MIDGFESPDTGVVSAPGELYPRDVLERVFEDMAGARGFTRYVALVDGEVACGGSMRLFEGVAQLCGATTRPRFRTHRHKPDCERLRCSFSNKSVSPRM